VRNFFLGGVNATAIRAPAKALFFQRGKEKISVSNNKACFSNESYLFMNTGEFGFIIMDFLGGRSQDLCLRLRVLRVVSACRWAGTRVSCGDILVKEYRVC